MAKMKRITKLTKKTLTSSTIFLPTTNRKIQNKNINYDNKTWNNFCGKKNEQEEVRNVAFPRLNLLLMFVFEEVKKKMAKRINRQL